METAISLGSISGRTEVSMTSAGSVDSIRLKNSVQENTRRSMSVLGRPRIDAGDLELVTVEVALDV